MTARYFKVVKEEDCKQLDQYLGQTLKLRKFRPCHGGNELVIELELNDKDDWYAWYADSLEEVYNYVPETDVEPEPEPVAQTRQAPDFLEKGAALMRERGKQYDKPDGERSMGVTVKAFNTITGRDITESEGWLLMQILKDVRQWQNPDKYHEDSAEDCIAYAALKAEALAQGL